MKKLLLLVAICCLAMVMGATASVVLTSPSQAPGGERGTVARTTAAVTDPQPFIDQGKAYLQAHNILAAREQFQLAVGASPDHQEANLLFGVTRVFAVFEANYGSTAGLDSVREIFERSGFTFQTFGLYDIQGSDPQGPAPTIPRTGAILDFVKDRLLPELDGALANLGKVTSTSFSSSIAPAALATTGQNIVVDYADVMVSKALLHAVKCNLNLLMVYGLDVNIPDIAQAPDQLLTYKQLFQDPAFLGAREPARLATAREALIGFIDTFSSAAQLLQARTGAGHHLFVVDALVTNEPVSTAAQDLQQVTAVLAEIRASLDGPKLLTFITSTDDRNRTLDLSRFFNAAAPINLRGLLADCSTGTMPTDATLGGLFPLGLTEYQQFAARTGPDLAGVACSGWEIPRLELDSDFIHFYESQGYSSGPRTLTLHNRGTAALTNSSILLLGPNAADFTLTAGSCGSFAPVIEAGKSCTVGLDLKRPVTVQGTRWAQLQIASNDRLSPAGVQVNANVYPTTGSSVTGMVREAVTGAGIGGAQVALYQGPGFAELRRTTTNQNGGYGFNGLSDGDYKIYVFPVYRDGVSYQGKWYNNANPFSLYGQQLENVDLTLVQNATTLTWGSVWHRTRADGSTVDVLDAGINTSATTLAGLTLKVDGPDGFSYLFTEADKVPFLNNRFSLVKEYPAGTLPLGVYTFTLTDANGNKSYRVVSLRGASATLPRVESATIKFQRKADGSYRFSWAPANDTRTYYYRLRIALNDASSTPVHLGVRNPVSYVDVPQGTILDGTAYKIRVEVSDAPTTDLANFRSDSSYVNFTPQLSDYDASRLLVNNAVVNNRYESNGALSTDVLLSVSNPGAVSAVELRNASGSVIYTFQAADRSNQDFYKRFSTPLAPGSYVIRFTANGVQHDSYVTLTAPVSYPLPNAATMQAEDLGNGSLRFSWANVNYTGDIHYRVQVYDKITGPTTNAPVYSSPRQRVTYADIPKTALGDLSTKQWRVEIFDSNHGSTQRNRVNGAWQDLNPAPYDAGRPMINTVRLRSLTLPAGASKAQILVNVSTPQGTLSQLTVAGPGGFSRDLLSQGRFLPVNNAYTLDEPSLAAGLYTVTAVSAGKTSIRYHYYAAAAAIPAVDLRTLRVNYEPSGEIRISWAPVASERSLWYQVSLFGAGDQNADGLLDAAAFSPMGNVDATFDGITDQLNLYPLSSVLIPAGTQLPASPMLRVSAFDGGQSAQMTSTSLTRFTHVIHSVSQSAMVPLVTAPGFDYGVLADGDGDGFAGSTDSNDANAGVYPFSGGNAQLPLSVRTTFPGNGMTVPGNSSICATFNKVLDPRTLAGNVTVSGVTGTVTHSTPFTACFVPAAPLPPSTQFTATVGAQVKDEYGNALGTPFAWSFTTETGTGGTVPLTVLLSGTGSGSVHSDPPGVACSSGSSIGCSTGFPALSLVTLTATPAAYSTFAGWSGACSGTGNCVVSLNQATSVSATFNLNPVPVRIDGTNTPYFTLDSVLDAVYATAGLNVRAKAQIFVENVIYNKPLAVLFKGGFTDDAFSTRNATSFTVLDGSLKIRQGTLRVERLSVR